MGGQNIPIERRFWSKVNKTSDCWLWVGAADRQGYGRIKTSTTVLAHRKSWEIHNGPIPDGLLVCHKCDNPPCVRPDHLFLGTNDDNMADMVQKGRAPRQSRLTDIEVATIRRRYADGERWPRSLAREFGVSRSTIYYIVRRKTWVHV